MESATLSTMWDNVLSLVTEGVNFDLIPMPSQDVCHHPAKLSGLWEVSGDFTNGGLTAGGPPMPFGRIEADGDEYGDFVDGGLSAGGPPMPFEVDGDDFIDGDECAGGPPMQFGRTEVDGIDDETLPTPVAAAPPPPPPPGPPPPPVKTVDKHTEVKQRINRLIFKLKGIGDSKDLKKKDSEMERLDYDALDDKGREWADFNARGHQLQDGKAFVALANEKRKQIDIELKRLGGEEQLTLSELKSAAEVLGAPGDWYPGGIKEWKKALKVSKELEEDVETLVGFVNLQEEMMQQPLDWQCDGELQEKLNKTSSEFEKKHKRWGDVVLSDASRWRELRFPVCDRLLMKSRHYICGLVVKFVLSSLGEATRIDIDTSKEHPRTAKAKQRLEEAIKLLQAAALYFSLKQSYSEERCHCGECSDEDTFNGLSSDGHDTSELLTLTVRVIETYINLGLEEFEGFVKKRGKQKICDHFQSILGLLKKVEELVSSIPTDEVDSSQMKTTGVVACLPQGESLKQTMHRSCESLCEHVQEEAKVYSELPLNEDDDKRLKQEKTKEIVHWMAFFCKYSYRISVASGTVLADHNKTYSTTVTIALSFIEENLKQYDSFVRILDTKSILSCPDGVAPVTRALSLHTQVTAHTPAHTAQRIQAHFNHIMKVVDHLVSNIPTNGDSTDKSIKALPNGSILALSVLKSCDKLVQHYQSHMDNEISVLQAEGDVRIKKKREEEVSKWLVFGGEYLCAMLGALGKDYTEEVLKSFSEFEKVADLVIQEV